MGKRLIAMLMGMLMLVGVMGVPAMAADEKTPVVWDAEKSLAGSGRKIIFSNNNLTAEMETFCYAFTNLEKSTGKWYWEITLDKGNSFYVGVATEASTAGAWINTKTGNLYGSSHNGQPVGTVESFEESDIIGYAIDMDLRIFHVYRNGILITEDVHYTNTSKLSPSVQSNTGQGTITANFGAAPFAYNVPEGYLPYDETGDWFTPTEPEKEAKVAVLVEQDTGQQLSVSNNLSMNQSMIWTSGMNRL